MKTISRASRALAIAAVAGLAVTVVGCSSDDGGSAGGKDGDADTLEVWVRTDTESGLTYEAIFDAFTEKTGIKVDFTPVQEFDTQLQAKASQKTLPDVFIQDAGSLGQYQSQGYLLPVDRESLAGSDQISDATWEQNKGLDGEYYGIPWSRQATVLMLRKDWREAVGKDVPTTWEELSELAEAFANEDPDGNGKDDTYGMVVAGTAQNGYIARWANHYIWQGGGDILEADGNGHYTSVINSPENVKSVGWMRDQFCTPGIVPPNSITLSTGEAQFFAEGSAGIMLTGPYNISSNASAVGDENLELVTMPSGPANNVSFAEGENIYFGASSEKADAQKQLAEFMISPEGQELGMKIIEKDGIESKVVVRIPVNTSVDVAAVTGDDRWDVALEAYENDAHPFPWNINFIPYRQILADELNALMADCSSDIPAGLASIDEQFNAQLDADGLKP